MILQLGWWLQNFVTECALLIYCEDAIYGVMHSILSSLRNTIHSNEVMHNFTTFTPVLLAGGLLRRALEQERLLARERQHCYEFFLVRLE